MARSYARIITAIWRNPEFRKLVSSEQRLYLLLVTQPDITAAGTLPLTVRRWADLAGDTTVQIISNALDGLVSGRFIAVDRDSEELLVRSFVKWDGGHTNSKRRPVIFEAASGVMSAHLRKVLAFEFDRLGLPTDALSDTASSEEVPESDTEDPETLFPQVDTLSVAASGARSSNERVAVTQVSNYVPQPSTRKPQPVPPSAAHDDEPAGAQQIIGAWIEACPKRPPGKVIGQISKDVKAMLVEGIAPADVLAGLMEWERKGLNPSTLASVVHEVMNRPAGRVVQNQTDANIAAFLGTGTDGPALYALTGGGS